MNQTQGNDAISEKRAKSRITCNFAAVVRGRDEKGREFEENARVVNMSASGIYMLLNRSIGAGEQLSVRIALPTGSLKLGSSKLLTDGHVVRAEPHATGAMGIALKFNNYRFR